MVAFGFALGHTDSFLIFYHNAKISKKEALLLLGIRTLSSSLSPVLSTVLGTQMLFELNSTREKKGRKIFWQRFLRVCSISEEYERDKQKEEKKQQEGFYTN